MRTASPRGQKVGPRAQVVTRERLPYLGTRGAKTACYDHIRDGMGPSEAERSRASQGSMFQTQHLSPHDSKFTAWAVILTPLWQSKPNANRTWNETVTSRYTE